jgi:hypothetical protein
LKNILLSERTRADINRRIERVLKGLDNPEPPLRLQDVRELLALDRRYYTGDDDGVLQETISRLRVAGIQVVKRPSLLVHAVRKFDLKSPLSARPKAHSARSIPAETKAPLERGSRNWTQPSTLASGHDAR